MTKPPMNDELLLRYSRQIMLPEFDIEGQESLRSGIGLIVGLGGLGCPAALYMAAAGVGELILADFDSIELSNLQRQIAHSHSMIGKNKAHSVADAVRNLNPDVKLTVCQTKLSDEVLLDLVKRSHIVVDCTDNFETRSEINKACVAFKVPLVSGSAIRWEGQLSVFDFRNADSPCYHCLYGNVGSEQLNCSQVGVMSPVVGIIGAMQALEAIKVLTSRGQPLTGKLLVFDGMYSQWREFKLSRDPKCTVC